MIRYSELTPEQALQSFVDTPDERRILSHPFRFKRAHFVASVQSRRVGRISANLSERDPSRGYFGFFKIETGFKDHADECALGLIACAEAWLKKNGVRQGIGPVNYSTLFEYRVRLDHQEGRTDPAVFAWEPAFAPECVRWIHQSGYELLEEYHSRAFRDPSQVLPISEKRYLEALGLGFKTRPIEFTGAGCPDLVALFRINSRSFQDTFLSEPFDFDAYASLNVPHHASRLSEFSFFILDPEGREIGYFFLFVDQGYLVWKTLAILPEYQKAGLAGFGMHHALLLARQKGITKVISALVRKGAPSESLLLRAEPLLLWEHRYGVFKKDLP